VKLSNTHQVLLEGVRNVLLAILLAAAAAAATKDRDRYPQAVQSPPDKIREREHLWLKVSVKMVQIYSL
jgi:hypothetical protein